MKFLACMVLALLLSVPSIASAAGADVEYVKMQSITIPIITDDGLFQQFSFEVSLEVEAGKKDDVQRLTPRLADAYIQDLYGALGNGFMFGKNHLVDVAAIKSRLSSVTDQVLAPEDLKANGVLIQVMHQKPM